MGNYAQFRRRAVTPYWCDGDPLRWTTPENIGISHLARQGNVGVFNLSWWLLGKRDPPSAYVYKNTNIIWAITVAPYVMSEGFSLSHRAAMMTCPEFNQHLLVQGETLKIKVERQGMAWNTLRMLATRKQFV